MQAANQINIKRIIITSISGRWFDASLIFTQLLINESLYMPTMNGQITIVDDKDHYELLPIIGQERLEVEVETLDEVFTFPFFVYKVSEIRKTSQRRSEYTLYFVSEEQIVNENTRIRRSYSQMKYSRMMEDILTNEIGTKKNIAIEPTLNNSTHVVPNIRPFKSINQICRRSISESSEQSNYMFFEDRRGFMSAPLRTFTSRDSKYTYRHNEAVGGESTPHITDPFQIMKLDVKKQSDTLDSLESGMFASQLHIIDPILRTIETYDYGYFQEFQRIAHMNPHPVYIETDLYSAEGNQYFTYSNENILESEYVKEHDSSIIPEQSSEMRLRRRLQMKSFSNYVVTMSIPGNALLFIGDIINLDVPSALGKEDGRQHKTIAGNSLVSAITHVINQNDSYMQRVETIKDSLVGDLGEFE